MNTDQLAKDLDAFRDRDRKAKDPKAKPYNRSQSQRDRLEREYREGYAAYLMGIAGGAPTYLSLPAVAKVLGVTRGRVWQLVKAGRLKAVKVGRDWLVDELDLEGFRPNPPGHPKKAKTDPSSPS